MSSPAERERPDANRRAQVSLEFILIVGTATLLLVTLLTVTAYQLRTATTEGTLVAMDDITQSVRLELLTARAVGDGYARSFTLPRSIQGRPYTLNLTNEPTGESAVLSITTAGRTQSLTVPACQGSLAPGPNSLTVTNATIRCNP